MAGSKKGFSAHQMHRTLKLDYKSAWFLEHRIRECMDMTAAARSAAKARSSRPTRRSSTRSVDAALGYSQMRRAGSRFTIAAP
jgi:hypothetical protein